MRYTASLASAMAAGLFALAVGIPTAHAQLSKDETKCREGLAKAATKFVSKKQKAIQKCNDKNIKNAGSCTNLGDTRTKLEDKVRADIEKKCPLNVFNFANMGYPGKCEDANPADRFTLADLQDCIESTHEDAVDRLIDIVYGTTVGGLTQDQQKCQAEIGKNAGKFIAAKMKAIQKCRNYLNKGKLTGFSPESCETADPKTAGAITKAESKARAKIAKKCVSDADIQALDVCDPSVTGTSWCQGGTNDGRPCTSDAQCAGGGTCTVAKATTVTEAQDCVINTHETQISSSDVTFIDLLDIEYAAQPFCGDGVKNQLDEECDGSDDTDCPGQCGAADGDFACLCLNIPRQAVVEHANSDLDNGWTGISHDSGIVEGGSYPLDLYDCDNVTDFDCTVGPSCEGAPHPACVTNAQCQFFGLGNCRRRRTALGPHCNLDISVVCTNNGDCSGAGNFCVKHFHGAPLPLSSGGVSVCVVNTFSEDVVGTTNLQTGSSAVRLRQRSDTYLGPVANQPCPVCGGFCAGNLGGGGTVGQRQRCTTDGDCPNAPNHCVHDNICSYGAHADQTCRPDPPFGGPTGLFGNPSVDCGPPPGNPLSTPGLDILFNPATTGSTSLLPNFECDFPFQGNKCIGGANEGHACTAASDCPSGTCNEQCFCPTGGGVQERPNRCNSACRNGANNGLPCSSDAQCPSGFCETSACRYNPADTGSSQEGACVTGPSQGVCSVSTFHNCNNDGECAGANCPFCVSGETCVFSPSQCFVSSGITRTGSAGVPNKSTVAIFCIAATGASAVDSVAGLPGPGAITTPTTTEEVGF